MRVVESAVHASGTRNDLGGVRGFLSQRHPLLIEPSTDRCHLLACGHEQFLKMTPRLDGHAPVRPRSAPRSLDLGKAAAGKKGDIRAGRSSSSPRAVQGLQLEVTID